MKVIQLVEGYKKGDGVGNVVASFDNYLSGFGCNTAILNRRLVPYDIDGGFIAEDDILVYHFALEMDPLIKKIRCKKILVFHNITNPELLEGFDNEMRHLCSTGWYDLRKTAWIFDEAIVFSKYSASCLIETGWRIDKIHVLPIKVRFENFGIPPAEDIISKYSDGKKNILFTGRIYPNKKQENIISAFAKYREEYNVDCRLFLVGSYSNDLYFSSLKKYTRDLGIENAVLFPGHVSFREYLSYFHISDLFLCMSEHEGFCIPLAEAMYFDIPICAYNATAVPDTLGGCGVLLDSNESSYVADIINRILTECSYKESIIKRQRKRLEELCGEGIEDQYNIEFKKIFGQMYSYTLDENNNNSTKFFCCRSKLIDQIKGYNGGNIVVYGAGAMGNRVFNSLKNEISKNKLFICDGRRKGVFDEDYGCSILSPEEVVQRVRDAFFIISVQDRRMVHLISSFLNDNGVLNDKIFYYDRYKEQII